MRKSFGVLLAVASMLVPTLVIGASPASAATGLTCSKLTGTVTFTPPLPKVGVSSTVKSKSVAKGTFSGCTGTPGITSGKFVFTQLPQKALNCTTIASFKGSLGFASVSTTWNNGKTSAAAKLTVTKVGQAGLAGIVTVVGKGTGGTIFKGQTNSSTTLFTPLAGGCIKTGLISASLAFKAGTKLVIK